ncbi:MAG TPA: peptidoglycan recognition family protein [Acidimicrobiales bacterium]|nr:peptidoglycan recognition family protein [Acidimicrobiales bacterium]
MKVRWRDVRDDMPTGAGVTPPKMGTVTGVAIHHSAAVDLATGVSRAAARDIFDYHVAVRGWSHGAYHYLIRPNGLVEYALDETIAGNHAGQIWNYRLLAVCVLGWFDRDRVHSSGVAIPNRFTTPTPAQWSATVATVRDILVRHELEPDAVRGHRELDGCATVCPGSRIDLDQMRAELSLSGR